MPCLWLDTQAEEAINLYCSIFPNLRVTAISRYPEAGQEIHKKPAGSVIAVSCELETVSRSLR